MENNIENLKEISRQALIGRYDQFLDDLYGVVTIAGYKYSTSAVLFEIDPIAYDDGFNNWLDGELGETIQEIELKYYAIYGSQG